MADIRIEVQSNTSSAVAGLKALSSSLSQVSQAATGASTATGKFIGVGDALVGGLAVRSIVSGLSAATQAFVKFEDAVLQTAAVSTEVGQGYSDLAERAKLLSSAALEVAESTRTSVTEIVELQQQLAKAGVESENLVVVSSAVAKAAGATGESVSVLSEAVVALSNQFQDLDVSNPEPILDALTAAANSSTASVESLKESFKFVGTAADSVDQDFTEVVTTLASLDQAGLNASIAGRGLQRVFSELFESGGDAQAGLSRIGVSVIDASGQFRQFNAIAKDTREALASLDSVQSNAFIDSLKLDENAERTFKALIGLSEETVDSIRQAVQQSGGLVEEQFAARSVTFSAQVEELSVAFSKLTISLGQSLQPILQPLVEGLTAVIQGFNGLPPTLQSVILSSAGLSVALATLAAGGLVVTGLFQTRLVKGFIAAGEATRSLVADIAALKIATDGIEKISLSDIIDFANTGGTRGLEQLGASVQEVVAEIRATLGDDQVDIGILKAVSSAAASLNGISLTGFQSILANAKRISEDLGLSLTDTFTSLATIPSRASSITSEAFAEFSRGIDLIAARLGVSTADILKTAKNAIDSGKAGFVDSTEELVSLVGNAIASLGDVALPAGFSLQGVIDDIAGAEARLKALDFSDALDTDATSTVATVTVKAANVVAAALSEKSITDAFKALPVTEVTPSVAVDTVVVKANAVTVEPISDSVKAAVEGIQLSEVSRQVPVNLQPALPIDTTAIANAVETALNQLRPVSQTVQASVNVLADVSAAGSQPTVVPTLDSSTLLQQLQQLASDPAIAEAASDLARTLAGVIGENITFGSQPFGQSLLKARNSTKLAENAAKLGTAISENVGKALSVPEIAAPVLAQSALATADALGTQIGSRVSSAIQAAIAPDIGDRLNIATPATVVASEIASAIPLAAVEEAIALKAATLEIAKVTAVAVKLVAQDIAAKAVQEAFQAALPAKVQTVTVPELSLVAKAVKAADIKAADVNKTIKAAIAAVPLDTQALTVPLKVETETVDVDVTGVTAAVESAAASVNPVVTVPVTVIPEVTVTAPTVPEDPTPELTSEVSVPIEPEVIESVTERIARLKAEIKELGIDGRETAGPIKALATSIESLPVAEQIAVFDKFLAALTKTPSDINKTVAASGKLADSFRKAQDGVERTGKSLKDLRGSRGGTILPQELIKFFGDLGKSAVNASKSLVDSFKDSIQAAKQYQAESRQLTETSALLEAATKRTAEAVGLTSSQLLDAIESGKAGSDVLSRLSTEYNTLASTAAEAATGNDRLNVSLDKSKGSAQAADSAARAAASGYAVAGNAAAKAASQVDSFSRSNQKVDAASKFLGQTVTQLGNTISSLIPGLGIAGQAVADSLGDTVGDAAREAIDSLDGAGSAGAKAGAGLGAAVKVVGDLAVAFGPLLAQLALGAAAIGTLGVALAEAFSDEKTAAFGALEEVAQSAVLVLTSVLGGFKAFASSLSDVIEILRIDKAIIAGLDALAVTLRVVAAAAQSLAPFVAAYAVAFGGATLVIKGLIPVVGLLTNAIRSKIVALQVAAGAQTSLTLAQTAALRSQALLAAQTATATSTLAGLNSAAGSAALAVLGLNANTALFGTTLGALATAAASVALPLTGILVTVGAVNEAFVRGKEASVQALEELADAVSGLGQRAGDLRLVSLDDLRSQFLQVKAAFDDGLINEAQYEGYNRRFVRLAEEVRNAQAAQTGLNQTAAEYVGLSEDELLRREEAVKVAGRDLEVQKQINDAIEARIQSQQDALEDQNDAADDEVGALEDLVSLYEEVAGSQQEAAIELADKQQELLDLRAEQEQAVADKLRENSEELANSEEGRYQVERENEQELAAIKAENAEAEKALLEEISVLKEEATTEQLDAEAALLEALDRQFAARIEQQQEQARIAEEQFALEQELVDLKAEADLAEIELAERKFEVEQALANVQLAAIEAQIRSGGLDDAQRSSLEGQAAALREQLAAYNDISGSLSAQQAAVTARQTTETEILNRQREQNAATAEQVAKQELLAIALRKIAAEDLTREQALQRILSLTDANGNALVTNRVQADALAIKYGLIASEASKVQSAQDAVTGAISSSGSAMDVLTSKAAGATGQFGALANAANAAASAAFKAASAPSAAPVAASKGAKQGGATGTTSGASGGSGAAAQANPFLKTVAGELKANQFGGASASSAFGTTVASAGDLFLNGLKRLSNGQIVPLTPSDIEKVNKANTPTNRKGFGQSKSFSEIVSETLGGVGGKSGGGGFKLKKSEDDEKSSSSNSKRTVSPKTTEFDLAGTPEVVATLKDGLSRVSTLLKQSLGQERLIARYTRQTAEAGAKTAFRLSRLTPLKGT